MSVTVSGLTKVYDAQRAVDNITFEVKPGDVLGFLGPNGAGKSTTMKIITGFLPPSEGKATVCGFDVETNSLEAKKNIGYLPENNPIYADMYVREFLFFTGRLNHVKNLRGRVKEMIMLVGLEAEKHKKIGSLSKGYRQRVGLAQALLHDPKVLIMDEPTSGLDPNQLVGMRQLIKELGKEKTVILSTHIMQEVQSICNRVIIINKGKIVADDTVEKLQSGKSEEVVIRVTFKNPIVKNLFQQIKGVIKIEDIETTTYRIHSSFNNEEDIFRFAVDSKNIITSMQHEVAGLEDVFRELTNEK